MHEIEALLKTVKQEVSGARMLKTAEELSAFHRLQASAGYRAAAERIADRLRLCGIDAQIRSYPAVYGQRYLTQKAFEAWDCTRAWCRLRLPESWLLADTDIDALSVFQKSYPCDYRQDPIDIVLMDKGREPENYRGVDIKGKLLFIRDDFGPYLDWAIRKGGGAGLISDYVVENEGCRTREEMRFVRKYTTFWWTEEETAAQPFGFVLSPAEGARLAAICQKVAAAHEANPALPAYPQANCFVDAAFSKGSYENVEAFLPGETDTEIWMTAHLCHPKPSANDNLSGVAAAVEAMTALQHLIERGALPRPRRGIRLLLVPEFTGLFARLQEDVSGMRGISGVRHVLAGLNLDMVGGKQELGYGPLTLSGVPSSMPSIAGLAAEMVFKALGQEAPAFTEMYRVPMFNRVSKGFIPGSDNFILSDPSVGIPSPMLSQWPDKFYHTSGDRLDVLCPKMLARSAAFAATYAWMLSSLSFAHAAAITTEVSARLPLRLKAIKQRADLGGAEKARVFDLCVVAEQMRLHDLLRYFEGAEQARCCDLITGAQAAMREVALLYKTLWRIGSAESSGSAHPIKPHESGDAQVRRAAVAQQEKSVGAKQEAVGGTAQADARREAVGGTAQADARREVVGGTVQARGTADARWGRVPVRLYPGPVSGLDDWADTYAKRQALEAYRTSGRISLKDAAFMELLAQYAMDGWHTVSEVADQVALDCEGADRTVVCAFVDLLSELGLCAWRQADQHLGEEDISR
jgi:hypothetical protein